KGKVGRNHEEDSADSIVGSGLALGIARLGAGTCAETRADDLFSGLWWRRLPVAEGSAADQRDARRFRAIEAGRKRGLALDGEERGSTDDFARYRRRKHRRPR